MSNNCKQSNANSAGDDHVKRWVTHVSILTVKFQVVENGWNIVDSMSKTEAIPCIAVIRTRRLFAGLLHWLDNMPYEKSLYQLQ